MSLDGARLDAAGPLEPPPLEPGPRPTSAPPAALLELDGERRNLEPPDGSPIL